MKTADELLDFIESLRSHDAALAVTLQALLTRAEESGKVDREEWLAEVREAYAVLAPQDGGQSPFSVPGDALEPYLREQVLSRLEGKGVAERVSHDGEWQGLRWVPELWRDLHPRREEIGARLERKLLDLRTEARTAVAAAPRSERTSDSLLRGEGLTKAYQGRRVVNEVDIHVRQGEIVGLLGPNGAGKTTTFYMIVGLIPPDGGRVQLDQRDITRVPMYRRARMGVGYLAQEPSVFRKLTVEENVLAILETMDLPAAEEKRRLNELLSELSIEHLRKSKAYSLSGGERRRLEITRALVQDPKFMLLDEPFAGIDPIAVSDIQQIVASLKDRRIGVIISDHNVEQTLDIVDRAYIMYEGRIRVSGSVSELVWNDDVAEIYLGPTLTGRMRQRYPEPVATT